MAALKVATLAAVLCGLLLLIACNDRDEDAKRTQNTAGTAQTATQSKPEEKPNADEDEERAPAPAAVAAEKAAPLQAAGQQLVYNFDADSAGQPPAKFHSARTGSGTESKWVVMPKETLIKLSAFHNRSS